MLNFGRRPRWWPGSGTSWPRRTMRPRARRAWCNGRSPHGACRVVTHWSSASFPAGAPGGARAPLLFAATSDGQSAPNWKATDFFNGKLDSPRVFNRALRLPELAQLEAGGAPSDAAGSRLSRCLGLLPRHRLGSP